MKNNVLFIQGGGPGAYEADDKLVAELKSELGNDYNVSYPRIPNQDEPEYKAWKRAIDREISNSKDKTIVVAHSLGAYFLIKYLTEQGKSLRLTAIFIIAAPYPGGDKNWLFEGFNLPENFGEKIPKDVKVFLYHSPDDHTVPFAHVALYAKEIPQAVVRETTGGHQLNNGLSRLAEDIKRL